MTVEVVMMSGLVVDESAVVHGSKHASTGTDPIPLGTTSAAGILQLASTGVPAATKPVRALGDDVAALLTAAGYTLTPATGANSMDGIADGDTYARTLKTIADALNAGTYDAPKCTAFGIGVEGIVGFDQNGLNTKKKGGFYYTYYSSGTDYRPYAENGFVIVLNFDTNLYTQIFITAQTLKIYSRTTIDGGSSWTGWHTIWSQTTDGNGGQPPAPKPNITASAIGEWRLAAYDSGADKTKIPAGGRWVYFYWSTTDSRFYTTKGVGGDVIDNGDVSLKAVCWRVD